MDGVKLEFDDDAIRAIAQKAIKLNTGARGLRSILEQAMLDVMYDIPGDSEIEKIVITKDTIETGERPFVVKKTTGKNEDIA